MSLSVAVTSRRGAAALLDALFSNCVLSLGKHPALDIVARSAYTDACTDSMAVLC